MILEKNSLSFQSETLADGGTQYTIRLPLNKEEIANE
jgi:hypothetical protein